ncbi:hypothetical protein P152DRAFT_465574 [Eremomyces bilateralis CBS 781.70]|uniref:Uncharacterized protein n=1 Tax=Eremomyces bilateralis CBS 781.70 TaxID=1392243 RepID=A0A6G1G6Z5_9PEZI|nr:uncharacterized protein P152DRAFT_465574 [Eremomyces bilateralis CBS 781.70]KAF1813721.1 hypothetical protein P152DRAFT_465574 [Eremomyces bilateralis CBS 781.70]
MAFATLGICQLQQVRDFSAGPTKVGMYSYVPKNIKAPAPIIEVLPLADRHGITLIFPNSKSGGGCFDVASKAIANMVKYAVDKYGGDANRTFVIGTSSGAMMANVLAGVYPDVFKAASVYSGVPDGCFYIQANACVNGQLTQTAQAWGDLVRSYYPGYTGPRTRMQIRLTTKKDPANIPQSGYTQTIYGDGTSTTAQIVGYSAQGVGHTVPQHPNLDIAFFWHRHRAASSKGVTRDA